MADPSAASRDGNQSQHHAHVSDPFATPTLRPVDLPTAPEPAAQIPSRSCQQPMREISRSPMLHGASDNDRPTYPYKSESMSSNGTMSSTSPMSSIMLEKSSDARRDSSRPKEHRPSKDRQGRHSRPRDPEKGAQSPYRQSYDRRPVMDRVAYVDYDGGGEEGRLLQEKKAVRILLFLSGPVAVLSLLNAIWTLISVLITLLAQPVRLCARRPTLGQQLGGLLGPALNLQLKSIYTPLPPHADEDLSYRPGMLLLVQLLSPCHSLGIMVAAWIVWIYWISSAVVGDPAGTDKRDDGRETALMLRDWWERWLVKPMKEADFP